MNRWHRLVKKEVDILHEIMVALEKLRPRANGNKDGKVISGVEKAYWLAANRYETMVGIDHALNCLEEEMDER